MSTLAIILNPRAGNRAKYKEFLTLLTVYKEHTITVFNLDRLKKVEEIVRDAYAQGFTTIIAAGGDGTVSVVVNAILSQKLDVTFGVLPMGTLNHFAKDISMPLMLPQAFEVLFKKKTTFIDVAKVNDMYFVNNSSLGLYPDIVREREAQKKKGYSKWIAFFITFISVVRRHPYITIEFETKHKQVSKDTPFLFVGNNKYQISGLDIGSRARLDQGILFVCMAERVERLRLVSLGISALFGNLMKQEDFNVIGIHECTITSKHKSLLVSYDGEVKNMNVPIHYEIIPKALSVIIP